jgi:hypothetical protein
MGGSNDSDNIVKLTYREHFICHRLLVKMTTGADQRKMAFAAWQQSRPSKHKNICITNRTYDHLRQVLSETYTGTKRAPFGEEWRENMRQSAKTRTKVIFSEERLEKLRVLGRSFKGKKLSDETKGKISNTLKGRIFSDDHRANISKAKSGKTRQAFSAQWKQKLSESHKGLRHSEETLQKMSNSMKGKNVGKPGPNKGIQRSDEVKRKISETKRNTPNVTCPHCQTSGKGGNMTRYHFDKCKSLNNKGSIPPSD